MGCNKYCHYSFFLNNIGHWIFVRSYCKVLFLCWHNKLVLSLVSGGGLNALKFFVLKFKPSVNKGELLFLS